MTAVPDREIDDWTDHLTPRSDLVAGGSQLSVSEDKTDGEIEAEGIRSNRRRSGFSRPSDG